MKDEAFEAYWESLAGTLARMKDLDQLWLKGVLRRGFKLARRAQTRDSVEVIRRILERRGIDV